jgi:hypothetical protein
MIGDWQETAPLVQNGHKEPTKSFSPCYFNETFVTYTCT